MVFEVCKHRALPNTWVTPRYKSLQT